MKTTRRRMDVNLEELDRVLDDARQAPLSEEDHDKRKDTLHALVAMLWRSRNSEKTGDVLPKPEAPPTPEANEPQKRDMDATEPRRLAGRGRSRLRIRN